MSWGWALVVAWLATSIGLVVQTVMRDAWQIRGLPERVMEWLLLFVPPALFERALGQFGASAKELALTLTTIALAGLLVASGAVALRRGWSSWGLLGLGLLLWLITMGAVMPVTGAGFFATALLISPVLTSAAYGLVFLGYASVLVGGHLVSLRGVARAEAIHAERRALLAGLVGVIATGGIASIVGRDGGLVASQLPQAAAEPTLQPDAEPGSSSSAAPEPPTLPAGAPMAAAIVEALPNPPPARALARNKDGSQTAAGRVRGELAPPITANEDFYVVTKNAVADPVVDAAAWRLIVDGEVKAPVQIDFRTLRMLPAVGLTRTLECISNLTAACGETSFGCDLISTARWKGARLSDVLDLAGGLTSRAVGLAVLSVDEFSAGLPAAVASDPETLIVYEMNGQPLPREHGFPARLLVPGRYGMKSPKWLAGIRAVNQEYQGWYEQRNWTKHGIVKTMSRIDVPSDGSMLPAGEQRLAGIAYAGDRGVHSVEFSLDGGIIWQPTSLIEPMPGKDAMVRWQATFSLRPGTLVTITTRATDGTGAVQAEESQLPQPDGASGRDSIAVRAG